MKSRNHWIYRAYIAGARGERYEPDVYLDGQWKADMLGFPAREPATVSLVWEESKKLAKIIYDAYGFTSSQQFEKGIIAQPGHIENAIICADLRRVYGNISDVPGFDKKGVFVLERHNDFLMPIKENGEIIELKGQSSRVLKKAKTTI